MIDGQLMGDEIDLQMFKYSNYTIKNSDRAIFEVTDGSETLQVLKINQYESRFQSMSVIVRHCDTKRLFVLAKGATELIHAYSTMKYSEFDSLIK